VLGRRAADRCGSCRPSFGRGIGVSVLGGLPPVALDDRANPPLSQLRRKSERRVPRRVGMVLRDPPYSARVEVVVVIVRLEHDVDRRQRIEVERRWCQALWPNEPEWRRTLAPHRIGEDVEPSDLNERSGMPHPRHGDSIGRGARRREARSRAWKESGRRIWHARVPTALGLPAQDVARVGRLGVRPGVTKTAGRIVVGR
jgi:hypothetical protein